MIWITYCADRMKRIYLDVCCLSRPFDDQAQSRVHLESEAVLTILAQVEQNRIELVSSEAVVSEIAQNPNVENRRKTRDMLRLAKYHISVGEMESSRALELQSFGFRAYDALHTACAESGDVDVFLTTDDRLLKLARRCGSVLVKVCNPLHWASQEKL